MFETQGHTRTSIRDLKPGLFTQQHWSFLMFDDQPILTLIDLLALALGFSLTLLLLFGVWYAYEAEYVWCPAGEVRLEGECHA